MSFQMIFEILISVDLYTNKFHTEGGLEISKVFYFIKLRQLHVNFLQWLIKYMNICGGSRIIAENNEIHLMKK